MNTLEMGSRSTLSSCRLRLIVLLSGECQIAPSLSCYTCQLTAVVMLQVAGTTCVHSGTDSSNQTAEEGQ